MSIFRIASIFSDNCVLQRDTTVRVFGEGQDGATVTAHVTDGGGATLCAADCLVRGERWELFLPPLPAMTDATLFVDCREKHVQFRNVAVGEVWLAGGQSNMELELGTCAEGPAELARQDNPLLRFYYTQKRAWMDESFYEEERNNRWQLWGDARTHTWSAVGYFFAQRLAETLGVTVGIIGCNWGGTSASSWIPREVLERDVELSSYLTDYEQAVAGKSESEQDKEYDDYEAAHAAWLQKFEDLCKTQPDATWESAAAQIGPCLWPGPMGRKNPYRPAALYTCMVRRIMPYTLKGFIYYQGESDDHKPKLYYRLFRELIGQWRGDWQDESLPFLFVQLPMHRYKDDRDFKNWCLIREAQCKTFLTVRNAGMVCAADLGQYNDIHPKAKRTVGRRLAERALSDVYGLLSSRLSYSPCYHHIRISGEKAILSFRYAEDGFVYKKDEAQLAHYIEMERAQGRTVPQDFSGFELAGADGVYHPAEFVFGAGAGERNVITLSSPAVPRPISARYAWYNYGPAQIYGRNGLPLVPFRTDDRDDGGTTGHGGIRQVMEV